MARYTFEVEAGLLLRKAVRDYVKRYCFERDLSLEVDESKGLLESNFMFKISGEEDTISRARKDIPKYMNFLLECSAE
ncbi:MAG: hypothetical protein Q7S53_00720 [bacterium]|nr:hypothetical protein [bacterium]